MPYKNYVLLIAFSLVLICCSLAACRSAAEPSRLEARLGKQTVQVLSAPKEVFMSAASKGERGTFVRDSKEFKLTEAQVKALQGHLLSDRGYEFDMQKKCLFIPQYALHFVGTGEATVIVSTLCKQLKIIAEGKTTTLDYDPMGETFSAFCRGLFESQNNK